MDVAAPDIVDLADALDPERFGEKAARLARLARAGAAGPPGFALSIALGARIGTEGAAAVRPALDAALQSLEARRGRGLGDPDRPMLLSVRASAGHGASGAHAILNIGATAATEAGLAARIGLRAARDLRRRLIQSFAPQAMGVDPEALEQALFDRVKAAGADDESGLDDADLAALIADYLRVVEEETGAPFPDDPAAQLLLTLEACARAWNAPRARLLRRAHGDDPDEGLGFVVQAMALGVGPGLSGAGLAQARDDRTGATMLSGRWLPQAQGEDALMGLRTPALVSAAQRKAAGVPEPSLEEQAPETAAALRDLLARAETALGDACRIEFTIEDGVVEALDAQPLPRSPRAAVRIAVELAEAGLISREDALLRVDPRLLIDHLHPTVDPSARRDVIARGLPASPGAAAGPLVFTAEAAEQAAARGAPAILARVETSPEDIRGMHVAAGVVTARGGMTSHAAVVARGLGAPCVVGASDIRIDHAAGTLKTRDGRIFREGEVLTVDGAAGEAMAGRAPMIQPELTGAFATLMDWSAAFKRMGVRANADTPADARVARRFAVDGIGLCRTEHMFFEKGRITAMREMILAEDAAARREALSRLLPWQRADFVELFEIMRGLPVTIRLLDPPLHEFLPHGRREMAELAAAMGVSVDRVEARAEELAEFNPMLGMRGCRLGVTLPEIYEMQVRAILEAALDAAEGAEAVVPEIMVPLVATLREIELIRARIDAVAAAVAAERGAVPAYKVGCMVETPRAALRAEQIAQASEFLSFGTNDLTQMTYGLSRDDAGRFMRDYIAAGVFPVDPFHSLDIEGVGELLLIAAERGRRGRPGVTLGLCGEHGGDPASVRFCELAHFDYVSCSPFRAPIARLAAAQAHILARRGEIAAAVGNGA
ncbi:MAG: pyruvate, phosphate dikinase [Rubrimonas sp.]|uniref:pyruvate, phosphate dikinase n=1 Tax=Rubrimonas sp. TaxID=2036015 RepID=UPI002FDDF597